MPKEVVEQGTFERVVVAVEKLAGDPEVLTGIEELSVALAGPGIDAPVGSAIEKLADAVNRVADAQHAIAKLMAGGMPTNMRIPGPCECKQPVEEPAAQGPDPACVGPANPHEGMGRAELRKLCDKRKIHTNSKMSIARLIALLEAPKA